MDKKKLPRANCPHGLHLKEFCEVCKKDARG